MKKLLAILMLISTIHLAFSQTSSVADLKTILAKLKEEKLISSKTELSILDQLDTKVGVENRTDLFQLLIRYAIQDFEEDLIGLSESSSGETLANEEDDDLIYINIPLPNTFGSIWAGLKKIEIDEKKRSFKKVLNFFENVGLLTEKETKNLKIKIEQNDYYFDFTFYESCLNEIKN